MTSSSSFTTPYVEPFSAVKSLREKPPNCCVYRDRSCLVFPVYGPTSQDNLVPDIFAPAEPLAHERAGWGPFRCDAGEPRLSLRAVHVSPPYILVHDIVRADLGGPILRTLHIRTIGGPGRAFTVTAELLTATASLGTQGFELELGPFGQPSQVRCHC